MRAEPIEQRVGHFVRDDIVRETGKNNAARQRSAFDFIRCGEIAKTEFSSRAVIIRVLLTAGVGPHPQPTRRLIAWASWLKAPRYVPAERAPESRMDDGTNGINHLLMKKRLRCGGIATVIQKQVRLVEIYAAPMDFF